MYIKRFEVKLKKLFSDNDYELVDSDLSKGICVIARDLKTGKEIRCTLGVQFVEKMIKRYGICESVNKIYSSLVA